eukprot:2328508-Lingulodinium_polyedra.AAC.1
MNGLLSQTLIVYASGAVYLTIRTPGFAECSFRAMHGFRVARCEPAFRARVLARLPPPRDTPHTQEARQ